MRTLSQNSEDVEVNLFTLTMTAKQRSALERICVIKRDDATNCSTTLKEVCCAMNRWRESQLP